MLKIKVYSDFVCPFCFLAEFELKKAIKEAGAEDQVEVEWMPYELCPEPNPPMRPEDAYLQKFWKESVYPVSRQLGVKMVLPRISPQPYTHLAFEGFQFAKEQGKAEEYNHRMFTAYFQEEQNIGVPEVLVKLAAEIGLDPVAFEESLRHREFEEIHKDALYHAYEEMGIQDVPSFMIGDEFIGGLLPHDIMADEIKKALRKQKSQGRQ